MAFLNAEALKIRFRTGGCGGCPLAGGGCDACPLKSSAVRSEISVFKPSILTAKLEKIEPRIGIMGLLPFRPVSSEKSCSQCGKNPTACPHSESIKPALVYNYH